MEIPVIKHALLVLLLISGPASTVVAARAAERTITLSIPAMDCAACPCIVEQTIRRLNGVQAVGATLEDRAATVIFDDAIVSVDAITQATLEVGYEAILIEPAS